MVKRKNSPTSDLDIVFDEFGNYVRREVRRNRLAEASLDADPSLSDDISRVSSTLRGNTDRMLNAAILPEIHNSVDLDDVAPTIDNPIMVATDPLQSVPALHAQLARYKSEQIAVAARLGDTAKIAQLTAELIELGELKLRYYEALDWPITPRFDQLGTTVSVESWYENTSARAVAQYRDLLQGQPQRLSPNDADPTGSDE
ncbi:MAG: hypothetical protein MI725_01840 [Pirellulales bacterium]|nr:hypothetical protein [Pirellulales bacterium]